MFNLDRVDFIQYFPEIGGIREGCPEETLNLLVGESVRQVLEISRKDCQLVKNKGEKGLRWKFEDIMDVTHELPVKKSEVLDKIKSLGKKHHLFTGEAKRTKAEHYGGSTTQFIWKELFNESVVELTALMKKSDVTFEELLDRAIVCRKSIGRCLNHSGMKGIETRRDVHEKASSGRGKSYTRFVGRYWDYVKRDDILLRLGVGSVDIPEEMEIAIVGEVIGGSIPLTTILLTPKMWFMSEMSHGGFNHTHPKEIPKILDHVEQLFQKWKGGSFPPDEEIGRVGEMHWWLCHAMPYPRGSAACAEMLVEAMMQHKEIPFSGFKEEVQVDLEALTTPSLEDYVKAFPSYLK